MPVFDTPITSNDTSLDRVLAQKLPIILCLFQHPDGTLNKTLDELASAHAGKLLIVRVNAAENPATYDRFGKPALPAILTLENGNMKAKTESATSADARAHASYALGQGPLPAAQTQKPAPPRSQSQGAASSSPIHIQDSTFASEVLQSDLPVLVDFWADWCGPCHMIAPVLDRLAGQYAGRVKFTKLNVDENPTSASRYQVSGIPQLLLFKNGQIVGKLVGAHPQNNIEQLIAQAL
jgi:thioredoxin 1